MGNIQNVGNGRLCRLLPPPKRCRICQKEKEGGADLAELQSGNYWQGMSTNYILLVYFWRHAKCSIKFFKCTHAQLHFLPKPQTVCAHSTYLALLLLFNKLTVISQKIELKKEFKDAPMLCPLGII